MNPYNVFKLACFAICFLQLTACGGGAEQELKVNSAVISKASDVDDDALELQSRAPAPPPLIVPGRNPSAAVLALTPAEVASIEKQFLLVLAREDKLRHYPNRAWRRLQVTLDNCYLDSGRTRGWEYQAMIRSTSDFKLHNVYSVLSDFGEIYSRRYLNKLIDIQNVGGLTVYTFDTDVVFAGGRRGVMFERKAFQGNSTPACAELNAAGWGTWSPGISPDLRLGGDRRHVEFTIHPVNQRFEGYSKNNLGTLNDCGPSTPGCRGMAVPILRFQIEDYRNQAIQRAVVNGPGLPDAGITLYNTAKLPGNVQPFAEMERRHFFRLCKGADTGGTCVVDDGGQKHLAGYDVSMSDTALAQLDPRRYANVYTIAFYSDDTSTVPLFTETTRLTSPPYISTQINTSEVAGLFPTLATDIEHRASLRRSCLNGRVLQYDWTIPAGTFNRGIGFYWEAAARGGGKGPYWVNDIQASSPTPSSSIDNHQNSVQDFGICSQTVQVYDSNSVILETRLFLR